MSLVYSESRIESEFEAIDSKDKWALLFQRIRSECQNHDYGLTEAKKLTNHSLNRYRDVSPYDHTRIVLQKGDCDYINASLVEVKRAKRRYILTQGPLPNTTGHFWQMIWEQKCPAVLMLNRIIEKKQVKCHQYWPAGAANNGTDCTDFEDVGLRVEYVSERRTPHYITRVLRLVEKSSEQTREVLQFHYVTWPDFGVPQSPNAFLRFLWHVRRSGCLDSNATGPTVVHCSAGIGRSGTFCLVDSCLVMLESEALEQQEASENGQQMPEEDVASTIVSSVLPPNSENHEDNIDGVRVVDILLEMRKSRMGLIQTPDQLRFSYQAVIQGAKTMRAEQEKEKQERAEKRPREDDGDEDETEKKRKKESFYPDEEEEDDGPESKNEVTNGVYDKDEEDGDGEPPPLPPRYESTFSAVLERELSKAHEAMANLVAESRKVSSDNGNSDNFLGPPDRPLPMVPGHEDSLDEEDELEDVEEVVQNGNEEHDEAKEIASNGESTMEESVLRERRKQDRAERNDRMRHKLEEMKQRQAESEMSSGHSSTARCAGIVLVSLGVAGLAYYLYSYFNE